MTVSASSASDLRDHVTARLAVVVDEAACTPSATLPSPTTGPISSPVTYASTPAALAAGASVVVCVQNAMSSVTNHSGKSLDGTVVSATTASAQSGWSDATPAATFTQAVQTGTSPFSETGVRYNIFNRNLCVERQWNDEILVYDFDCDHNQLMEWLIHPQLDGQYRVELAWNADSQPDQFWSSTTSGGDIVHADDNDTAAQSWEISERPDGTYRIRNEEFSECAVVSNSWHTEASSYIIELAPCNDSDETQGFTFEIVADANPPIEALQCDANSWGNYIAFEWSELPAYQHVVDYKVYVNDIFAYDQPDGHWTVAQFYADQGHLHPSLFGTGVLPVRVEQSVHGGIWTETANGEIRITQLPDRYKFECS
ncbi:MAG TPA: hypothetical protein PK890_08280 [Terrimesophilobacter sp.]|nr:hypothetical protein [Terrimesophilobacter sp.]